MANFAEDRTAFKEQQAEEEQQFEADAAINLFLQQHAEEIVDCTATRQAISDYFNGDDVTLKALETSWTNHPAFREMLATHSPSEDRDKLEAAIKELLAGGGSPGSVIEQTKKFRFKSTDELRVWHKDLLARKNAREKTPEQLRQEIRAADPALPPLPSGISRDQILHMLSADEIRHLMKRHGAAAVTQRVNKDRD
jgi:hypothetical protein